MAPDLPVLDIGPDVLGLIFDCDGTLADTMMIHLAAWQHTLCNRVPACRPGYVADLIDRMKGAAGRAIVAQFNRETGRRLDPVAVARDKNSHAYERLRKVRPIAPVASLASRYDGALPMAVASGGARANVERTLAAIGLAGCFAAVLTGDDDLPPKPDPALFLEAARRIGVAPQRCQVFEDGDLGLTAARRAGMLATDVRPYCP